MPISIYGRIILQDLLITSVARGDWSTVIEIYRKYPESQKVVISKSGDTAIHIAIANGLESVGESLVSICENEALEIGNERGDTPLHVAAKVGSDRTCKCIAKKDSNLIGSRNENGETPLFVAVSHGKMDALLCLLHICKEKQHQYYAYYRRNNGDTILHSAISQQHFDIAFYIIHEYGRELVDKVNEDGMSPLHLLASKPSSFPTGTHLSGLRKLAYHCLYVSKLNRRRYDATFSNSNWLSSCLTTLRININNLPECCGKDRQLDEEGGNEQGYAQYASLRDLKKRCVWSLQVMNKLLKLSSKYDEQQGCYPPETNTISSYEYLGYLDDDCCLIPKKLATTKMETPLLIAAKNGVLEIVEGILAVYPDAIFDVNTEKKNIVMLAVENRHLPLYKFLLEDPKIMKTIFGQVDNEGNTVLHIAANLSKDKQPWRIRGAALEMYMEVKWYKFVKHSMPPGFFARYNDRHQTPGQIFKETHEKLIDEGRQWLTSYSNSASLVSALIATVAFPTSATFPGGVQQDSGSPTLKDEPIFIVSAISSLIALCFSMIALVMFMVIPTSAFRMRDFRKDLPLKLLVGLISLFMSILSMLVSFCAGHFFVLKDKLNNGAIPVYALCCLPLLVFITAQFLLDFEMVWITLKKDPQHQQRK